MNPRPSLRRLDGSAPTGVRRLAVASLFAILVAACGSESSVGDDSAIADAAPGGATTSADAESPAPTSTEPVEPCIPSGDHTDIQSALLGVGDMAVLCPNAVFELAETVFLTADDQEIHTEGLPTDDTRAVLRVAHKDIATAVHADAHSGATLRHVIIDGARPELGAGSGALIEWGGAASDQLVEWVRAGEPRGWSILYLGEGHDHRCTDATARHNELGPGGSSEFGLADGISLACRNSVVEDNLIYDVTDGGIVIFQAPGSLVARNTIRADERIMFYGISMEDYGPFDGDFTGTRVVDNIIDARGALIRRGIAMGPQLGCIPDDESFLTSLGATVTGNMLEGEHMGYGFIIGGVRDWTATGNVDNSTHRVPARELSCFDDDVDAPAGFQIKAASAAGTFQPEFQDAVLGFTVDWWPTLPIASESCMSDLVGAGLFAEIRAGLHGPLRDALEATPDGALIEQCVESYEPELTGGGEDGIVFTTGECGPECTELQLLNLADGTVDLAVAEFFVDMFPVTCAGLPASLPSLEHARCEITDYLTEGSQVVWWRGFPFLNQLIVVDHAPIGD